MATPSDTVVLAGTTVRKDPTKLPLDTSLTNTVAPYVSTAIKLQQVAANDGVTLQGGATTILDNIGMYPHAGALQSCMLTYPQALPIRAL